MRKSLLLLGFVAGATNAEVLEDLHFGLVLNGSSVYFEDFEGEGESSTYNEANALNGTAIYYLERDLRVKTDLSYRKVSIDPDVNVVGQEGSLLSLAFQTQFRLEVGRLSHFWVGAGLGYVGYDFEDRFTVDRDGYVTQSYKDLEGNALYSLASVNREFPIAENWLLGVGAQYEYHLNQHIRATSIGLSLLYR